MKDVLELLKQNQEMQIKGKFVVPYAPEPKTTWKPVWEAWCKIRYLRMRGSRQYLEGFRTEGELACEGLLDLCITKTDGAGFFEETGRTLCLKADEGKQKLYAGVSEGEGRKENDQCVFLAVTADTAIEYLAAWAATMTDKIEEVPESDRDY